MKRLNRKEMLAIYHEGPEAVITLLTILFDEIEALRSRVEQLENQGKKNSKNSHKPPSSDEFNKPKPKSLRLVNGRKPGGQKRHIGHTLQPVAEPHYLVIHRVTDCSSCGHSLEQQPALRHEKRQVYDLPPLRIEVTQHEAEVKICPHCQRLHTASFPEEAKRPVQYGPTIKALVVYLTHYQLLPYERASSFFRDCLSHSISEGTLVNFNREISEALEGFEETIHHKILASPVAHFDETGMQVVGERRWLHVASTPSYTAYRIHSKRGQEAMDDFGILPAFSGIAIHDGWASYFTYKSCKHALCNVHHLRELTAVWEEYGQTWAADMMTFLLQVKQEVEKLDSPCGERLQKWKASYQRILKRGERELRRLPPFIVMTKGRGKQKQHPAKNLWDRLNRFHDSVLAFAGNRQVPFDNNQAERDVRMAKVKQKISGTFRSGKDARAFCRIRGFISTIKKQGINILEAIQETVKGNIELLPIK